MKQLPPGTPFDPRELVGSWSAAVGTFSAVMDESWLFGANGTGRATLAGSLSGTAELEFEWRRLEVGLLEVRLVRVTDPEADEDEADDRGEGLEPWERLSIVSALLPDEAGGTSRCVWTPPRQGFWVGLFPLTRAR